MEQIYLKPVDETTLDEQIRIFNTVFHESFTRVKWLRKHYENPYTGQSEKLGLYDGDKLIGFNFFMPQAYLVEGKECLVALSCESALLPEYRGHGYLGKILLDAEQILKERYDMIMILPNSISARTFEKLSYIKKGDLDAMVLYGAKIQLAKEAWSKVRKKTDSPVDSSFIKRLERMFAGGTVAIADKVPDDWSWYVKKDAFQILRGPELFHWKMWDDVARGRFMRCLYTVKDGKPSSYCVVSFTAKRRGCRGKILDWYAAEGELASFESILRGLKKVCSVITILVPAGGKQQQVLSQLGFRMHCAKAGLYGYKIINERAARLAEVLAQEDAWDYSEIESDTVLN